MKERGFTLIELVIAMGISSIIGLLLLVIIVNSTGVFYKQSSKLTEGLNINDAQIKIRGGLKQANAIVASFSSGGLTYTSGETQLVFSVPSIDASNNIISNTNDYYVFFLDANKLRFKLFPDGESSRKTQDQIISTSLDSLKFQYLDQANPAVEVVPVVAVKVRITLNLKIKSGGSYETKIATSEASLRND